VLVPLRRAIVWVSLPSKGCLRGAGGGGRVASKIIEAMRGGVSENRLLNEFKIEKLQERRGKEGLPESAGREGSMTCEKKPLTMVIYEGGGGPALLSRRLVGTGGG